MPTLATMLLADALDVVKGGPGSGRKPGGGSSGRFEQANRLAHMATGAAVRSGDREDHADAADAHRSAAVAASGNWKPGDVMGHNQMQQVDYHQGMRSAHEKAAEGGKFKPDAKAANRAAEADPSGHYYGARTYKRDIGKGGPGSGRKGGGGQSRETMSHNGYKTPISTVVNHAKQNYYDAAHKALEASKTANKTNSKADHAAAASAHQHAGSLIRRQEGLVGRTNASRVANMHDNAAKIHQTPSMHGGHFYGSRAELD